MASSPIRRTIADVRSELGKLEDVARYELATVRLAEAEELVTLCTDERGFALTAMHDAGESLAAIATKTGLTRGRVHQLIQRLAARA